MLEAEPASGPRRRVPADGGASGEAAQTAMHFRESSKTPLIK